MTERVKPIIWIGSSLADLRAFPPDVRRDIGKALYAAQMGVTDPAAKPMLGFGGAKVMEIVERHAGDTFRTVYTVEFKDAIYVLHAFQKKAKRRRETPKMEMDRIQRRLKMARDHHAKRLN